MENCDKPHVKEISNVGIRTEKYNPTYLEKARRRKYRKDDTVPTRAIELLALHYAAAHVAKILDVSPSQVHRYKSIALRLGILIDFCGINPRLYDKGPRYNLRKQRGWWSYKFEPIECRVHKGQGSSYVAEVIEYSSFEELYYRLEDGTVEQRPLFDKCAYRGRGYTIYKRRLPLPEWVQGKKESVYLEARKKTNEDVTLYIGPPPIFMSFSELASIDNIDPFYPILWYVENELHRHGRWILEEPEDHGSTHYAFDLKEVSRLCPELLVDVPHLRKGDNEESFDVYIDKSTPSGELETAYRWKALEIFAILEECRLKANGQSDRGK